MSTAPIPAPQGPVPDGLMEAFADYERALMTDDLEALDRLFAAGPDTLRGDAAGLLVGHDTISAFRGGRGGAPQRRIVETQVQVIDPEHALVVAVTELERGGRGQQTQLWARREHGWAVTAAHVSVPAPALDGRVWREVGDPLVAGAVEGPLQGERVAVKDLYSVAGHRVGAGNPTWLAAAGVEKESSSVVRRLLGAGADITGISRTDEFAYSLAGTNAHYGTPPNPRAPHRICGGSSSGSASAVSLGHATIGLGTDTGGSIRVPAAYQGLWGIRTSHGVVPVDGLVPLAPSFDTVGWLTRDPALLRRVGETLLPAVTPGGSTELVLVTELLELADDEVASAVRDWAKASGAVCESWPLEELGTWLTAFQRLQAWEAWQSHGDWLEPRMDSLGPDVRGRFEVASQVSQREAEQARRVVLSARDEILDLVGGRVLVLPSAASVAPATGPGLAERLQAVREATMRLTCLAGIGGLPAVSVPLVTTDGSQCDLPCGGCLMAAPGRDLDLLGLAEQLAPGPSYAGE